MPKGPKGEKRPADVIGAAVKVMQIATGEIEEDLEIADGNTSASALGRPWMTERPYRPGCGNIRPSH